MSKGRAYYQLISYGDAVYAMGGHDGSELDSMERWTKSEHGGPGAWVGVADLPYTNHRYVPGVPQYWLHFICWHFLGFWSTYRGTSDHFSTAREICYMVATRILKIDLEIA